MPTKGGGGRDTFALAVMWIVTILLLAAALGMGGCTAGRALYHACRDGLCR